MIVVVVDVAIIYKRFQRPLGKSYYYKIKKYEIIFLLTYSINLQGYLYKQQRYSCS